MITISIAGEMKQRVSELKLSCILSDVVVTPENDNLWDKMAVKIKTLSAQMKVEEISKLPEVSDSRKAYKACGKDPARYRLSAEALLRRVLKQKELYRVNNVVDLLNLVSISTGYSIGGYDADKIEGNIELGIGKENELYRGIGRGRLNIANLPVFRDDKGAFGSPTSDSVRTAVTVQTKKFLMLIIEFGASGKLGEATQMAIELLEKYAVARNVETKIIR